jgi:hypothetical protein
MLTSGTGSDGGSGEGEATAPRWGATGARVAQDADSGNRRDRRYRRAGTLGVSSRAPAGR